MLRFISKFPPFASTSGCTNGRKSWSWVRGKDQSCHTAHIFTTLLSSDRVWDWTDTNSLFHLLPSGFGYKSWASKLCFVKSFLPSTISSPQQAALKGHPMNFTHKGQFTRHGEYYSACKNCCIMSSVVLVGALKSLMIWRACVQTGSVKFKKSMADNRHWGSNGRCYLVAFWELKDPVFFDPDLKRLRKRKVLWLHHFVF